ncbi:MAG: WD40 repeat domain-containing protein [bacterium]
MHDENQIPKSRSLSKLSNINQQLVKIKNELFSENETGKLKHKIEFEILPVSAIHTYDVERVIYADYGKGDVARGFDIKCGKCFYEQTWDEENTIEFKGYKNCESYVMTNTNCSHRMRVFDKNKKRSMYAETFHELCVTDLALSNKYGYIITCSQDGKAKVFSSYDFRFVRHLNYESRSAATCLALVPFKSQVIVGYANGEICTFNLKSGSLIGKIMYPGLTGIKCISVSPDYIIASDVKNIFVFDLGGNLKHQFHVPDSICLLRIGTGDVWAHSPFLLTDKVLIDPFMSNLIFAATEYGEIYVFDIHDEKLVKIIEGSTGKINGLFISPSHHIITGGADGTIRRYNYNSETRTNIFYKNDGCRSVAFSKNKKLMCVTGIADNKAKIISLETGKIKQEFIHLNSIRCVAFSNISNKEYLFTGSWDRTIKQWRIDNGELINTFTAPGKVDDIQIIDGKLYSAFYDRDKNGGFQVHIVETGQKIISSSSHTPKERLSRATIICINNSNIFSAGDDGYIFRWRLDNGLLKQTYYCGFGVRSLCLSTDNNLLYAGLSNASIMIWNVSDSRLQNCMNSNDGIIYSMVMTDEFIFSGHQNGTINKYDLNTNSLIHSYKIHTKRVWNLCLSPDKSTLISASEDGTVKFISINKDELLGMYYNIHEGFLWSTPQDENSPNEYYWTNQIERVKLFQTDTSIEKKEILFTGERLKNYHAVFNNQKLVMSRICQDKFFEIYKASSTQINRQYNIDRLLEISKIKYLKEK